MTDDAARARAEELNRKLALAPYDSRRITLIEQFAAQAAQRASVETGATIWDLMAALLEAGSRVGGGR